MSLGGTEAGRRVLFGVLLAACLLSGCATVQKAGEGHWTDFFTPVEKSTASEYGMTRVQIDYKTLIALTRELEALSGEMAALKRQFAFRETPYLSDDENKDVEFLLFRFLNARDALWEMGAYYRLAHASDPDTHTRGSILGMSVGLNLMNHSSRFVALFLDEPAIIKLVNAAHPRYEISEGMFDTLLDSVTTIEHLELVEVAWYLFCKDLADPAGNLSRIRDTEPRFAALIDRMDELHANAHVQTGYIVHVSRSPIPDLINRLEHSQIAKVSDQISEEMSRGIYKVRGLVFRDVARIKNPGLQPLRFTDAQVRDIKDQLQPGDLLFTYSAGYMSNVFLPGSFKHGITYLGSVEERRGAGLSDRVLAEQAVSDGQRRALIERVQVEKTADGLPVDVIEAVAEGVVMHSLDEILATHINRLVVIRPSISDQHRVTQLVTLLKYVGAEYDFRFDFQDDTYQCCTELIYRTTNNLGSLNYPLVKTKGLWVLAADDILRYYLTDNPQGFEFILYAEEDPEGSDRSAIVRSGPEGIQWLHELMRVDVR